MGPLLADSFGAEEDSPSNVQAVLVDDMHKTALVWKHVSTGAFGDKGGIGDDHHYQVLYTLYYIYVKDLHNVRAQARKWMGGIDGIWCRQPPAPTETRWEYTGNAANFTLELLEVERDEDEPFIPMFFHVRGSEWGVRGAHSAARMILSARRRPPSPLSCLLDPTETARSPRLPSPSLPAPRRDWRSGPCAARCVEYMFEETKNYAGGASWKTKGWKAFATQFHDVRFKAKLVFESEFLDVYWRPRNAWNRSRSRQNFAVGFRLFDLAERIEFTDKPWWAKALADYGSVLPRTKVAIDTIARSTVCAGELTSAQWKDHYHKRMRIGITKG